MSDKGCSRSRFAAKLLFFRQCSHVTSLKAGCYKVPRVFLLSEREPGPGAMAVLDFPQLREYIASLPVIDVLALH